MIRESYRISAQDAQDIAKITRAAAASFGAFRLSTLSDVPRERLDILLQWCRDVEELVDEGE